MVSQLKEQSVWAPALKSARNELVKRADRDLSEGPFSVMHKTSTAASGDKHDYFTLGRYVWKEDGKTVTKDGRMNPETESAAYDKHEWEKIHSVVPDLAFAYFLMGKEAYAERAALLLRTWFIDPATRMNPNMDFAQCKYEIKGNGVGIIEAARLPNILEAVAFLKGSAAWTPADQKGMEKWAADYLTWLQSSIPGKKEGAAKNNHGNWYDVQVASLAIFTGNKELAARQLKEVTLVRMGTQIEPDGSQPEELKRTKSFSYSIYNLEAFFHAALLGDQVGVDLWHAKSANGASLAKALDFLVPYAVRPDKWPYEQIEPVERKTLAWILRIAAYRCRDIRYQKALESIPQDEKRSSDRLSFPDTSL